MATIYKRDNKKGTSYTLQWFINGKRHRKTLGFITDKQAKKALLEFELGLVSNAAESIDVPFLEDYVRDDYLQWHEMISSFKTHERVRGLLDKHILPFFQYHKLDKITKKTIASYQKQRLATRNAKAATINKEVITLKAVINHAVDDEIITNNSIRKVSLLPENDSKAISYFTDDELKLIYESAHKSYRWKLLANTGMRLGEAKHLKWEHINDKFIKIESTEQERTKSGKWRMVPLGDKAKSALLEFWRATEGNETARVYPQIGGYVFERTAPDTLSQAASRSIKALGLEGSAHKFRHTYISMLAMKGVPMVKLQALAGHATSKTTERYMHLADDYLSDVAEHC